MLKKTLLLDEKAILSSFLMALVLVYYGLNYLLIVIAFLLYSVAVTKAGAEQKKEMGLYEHMRGWENVIANGIVPIICLVLNNPNAFVGAVAAITSDKFASELGFFGDNPINLANLKKAKKGTNGAISVFGTLMSFLGGLLIGLTWMFLISNPNAYLVIGIALCGVIGSFGDSLAGVLEERGIGNKYTSNVVGAIFGALASAFLIV